MDTKVKICGIKTLEEISFINELDVDYIGLLFAKSKRQVNIETAKELISALKNDIKVCGVFVDTPVDEINYIADEVGIDIAQVHKNYTEQMVNAIKIPVWYAVSVKDENSIVQANNAINYDNVAGLVTDSHVKGQEGGTGVTFNWDMLKGVKRVKPLILAGGLNAENVKAAIGKVNPDVVDISSGVEHTVDGKTAKSKDKIIKLLNEVKGHE